ncbi:MAG TPA: hypothetical protein VMT63_08540 [Bacteroidales bacterium]|nr:hypothetical protein [Bacteroidales bacterium]
MKNCSIKEKTVTAVLVDDEVHCLESLGLLLENETRISITGKFSGSQAAYTAIICRNHALQFDL